MKVDKINHYKDLFKGHLVKTFDYNELYKYNALYHFDNKWDIEDLDFAKMYDKSLNSEISGRLWGGSKDSAKSMMLEFIVINKEFVRSMFRDLYNEDKDIAMRMNRFEFHCDELLSQMQAKGKKLNSHYHNSQVISMYLAFRYPQKYNIFTYGPFKIMMNRLEAKNIPQEFEVDRYLKLCNGLYSILKKDTELLNIHKLMRTKDNLYQDDTIVIVHDYLKIASTL